MPAGPPRTRQRSARRTDADRRMDEGSKYVLIRLAAFCRRGRTPLPKPWQTHPTDAIMPRREPCVNKRYAVERETERLARIDAEFVRGFKGLTRLGPAGAPGVCVLV
jgi:hypothetical protein